MVSSIFYVVVRSAFLGGALRTFFFVVRHKFVFVLGDL